LNIAVFFHGFTKGMKDRHKKTMRKIAGRCSQGAISVRRSCHGLDVLDGFHPSECCGQKLQAFNPRATGTLPVIVQSPECCWTLFCLGMNCFRKPSEDHALCEPSMARTRYTHGFGRKTGTPAFPKPRAKKTRATCARELTQRRMLCFSSSAL
jgi:hypothetical protein